MGYKAQMANVKLHNRKNKSGGGGGAGGGGGGDCDVDGNPDSPHHTPITAGRRGAADGDSDEDNPTPPPKKKKKVKGPQALQSSSQV